MDYLEGLNPSQRAPVEHTSGPVMVIAGAGSGKTRVLTYRIAHLIKQGADPFNVLALTFTNKAAKEMKERIGSITSYSESKNIWMGTFHSIFSRILRFESEKINFPSNFTIYDTQDSKSLIKSILKENGLDDKIYKVSIVQSRISSAKNNLISPEEYCDNVNIQADDRQAGRPMIGRIYQRYWDRCYKAGAMDFDDLLFRTNILLRDFPEVLHKYQDIFRYILVDEYQDTNHAQYLIVKKLAARYQNLCVVGDDAQSIYAFRGANIENILNFKKDYPDYALYKLEQNYRSTQNIVDVANSLIKHNQGQIQKNVWTDNESGNKVKVHKASSDNEEGFYVANSIFETAQQEAATYDKFAILYRTNAQSRSMEEALRKLNIPYKIFGGLSFYQRKEIKDALAYFRLVANPQDEEAIKRVINYPMRGIGKTTLDKIATIASEQDVSWWKVIENPKGYQLPVNGPTMEKLVGFAYMIKSFQSKLDTASADSLSEEIVKSAGILKTLHADKTPEGVSRYENIQELLNGIKEFTVAKQNEDPEQKVTLPDFLVDVALLTDADNTKDDEPQVSLMTIHASKGLEFPHVHIVGMEENLFPSQLSVNSRTDLEEERRLFYVAITRAEKKLNLSYAGCRFRWGNMTFCEPSRFLTELDEQFLDWAVPMPTPRGGESKTTQDPASRLGSNFVKAKTFSRQTATRPTNAAPSNFTPSKASDLKVGMEIEHVKFGKGKVLQLEGTLPDTKATVYFPSAGQKQLLLKFAKLKILG